jgi:flagellar biosynthesis GTPase FlhF
MAIVQRLKADTDENPRAVIGGNRAPIDEQIVIDLAEALASEGLTVRIEDLIASAGRAPNINSPEIAGRYADLIKQMVAAGKAVEAEREKLNRPLLNAQRALKGRADAIIAPLKESENEARAKVNRYDAEQAEIERKRRLEIEAQERKAREEAEAERRRLQAIADEEARQERLRLQAIADEQARKERLRLQAIEDERAAAEAREAAQVVVEAETIEVEAPIVEVEVAYQPAAPEPERTTIQGDMGAKVARVTTWHHRILSVRQLPDSILKHAKVVEALDKVIAAQVRGGIREMKGCEIYSETSTAIR